MEGYRVLNGGALIALDGVWYHASENIHRDRCLHATKDEVTTYYHIALAGAIVKPGDTPVLPVMIANGDGDKKRDCELTAAKRWLNSRGSEYSPLKPTLLGDDWETICIPMSRFAGKYWKRDTILSLPTRTKLVNGLPRR